MNQARLQPIQIGRYRELGQLWRLAVKGRHTLVCGPDGIGKTSLLKRLHTGLGLAGDLPVFRLGEDRQFKERLLELARQMHSQKLLHHPRLSPNELQVLPWEKIESRTRSLTVKALAENLVHSLRRQRAVLIWDQLDLATPAMLAWLQQFMEAATLIAAAVQPDLAKLKPLLDRVPERVEVGPLNREECDELITRCFEVVPFAVSDPRWYRQRILRQSQGNPRIIKDLLADHSLERRIDTAAIRTLGSEQGVRYYAISWAVLGLVMVFSIYRYVARGLGDRDDYIIGAVGMVVFVFLTYVVRKMNKT